MFYKISLSCLTVRQLPGSNYNFSQSHLKFQDISQNIMDFFTLSHQVHVDKYIFDDDFILSVMCQKLSNKIINGIGQNANFIIILLKITKYPILSAEFIYNIYDIV